MQTIYTYTHTYFIWARLSTTTAQLPVVYLSCHPYIYVLSIFSNFTEQLTSAMNTFTRFLATLSSLLLGVSVAQQLPSPENITIIDSAKLPGASISYKQTQICETTPGVKGYSGFVNLPPSPAEGRDYEIHTWFWFFEAREAPEAAPLSLWLNGGPGAPSTPAAVGENGPCIVLPDSRETTRNRWSWNDRVNMLYVDQPVQTGFSYDTLINGTIDEVSSPFTLSRSSTTNSTVLSGIFSSQNSTLAPNSTVTVAAAMWDFLQVWIQE